MRALILVAGAALAVSACSSNEAADNTMNVDNLAVDNLVVNDTTAIDATNMDMNATDANMSMNAATPPTALLTPRTMRPTLRTLPRPTRCNSTALPSGRAESSRGCRFVRQPLFAPASGRPSSLCVCSEQPPLRPFHHQPDRRVERSLPILAVHRLDQEIAEIPALRARPDRSPAAATPASARRRCAARLRCPPSD